MKVQTALSIVQRSFKRLNLAYPTSLLSLTDPSDIEQLEWFYDVCEELRRDGPFRQQIATWEFDTVSGTSTYPLPGDYYGAIPLTQYNQDSNWQLIGPLPDVTFMAIKEGAASIPSEYVWRIKGFDENSLSASGRQIEIYPTPASAENLTFEYISAHLLVPPNWAASTAYTSGNYVNLNGKIYKCDTNGTSGSTGPTGTGQNITDGTTRWDYFNEPYETVVSDSDVCIFDHDIVKLGIRARYLEDREKASADNAIFAFEKAKRDMRFRWEAQTIARGDRRSSTSVSRPYIQPGSWSIV